MRLLLDGAIAAIGSILPNGGAVQTARELSAMPAVCTTPNLSANDNWSNDLFDLSPPTIETRFTIRQRITITAGILPRVLTISIAAGGIMYADHIEASFFFRVARFLVFFFLQRADSTDAFESRLYSNLF